MSQNLSRKGERRTASSTRLGMGLVETSHQHGDDHEVAPRRRMCCGRFARVRLMMLKSSLRPGSAARIKALEAAPSAQARLQRARCPIRVCVHA
jgi:hypothetical protein